MISVSVSQANHVLAVVVVAAAIDVASSLATMTFDWLADNNNNNNNNDEDAEGEGGLRVPLCVLTV